MSRGRILSLMTPTHPDIPTQTAPQQTLAAEAEVRGLGLFSGQAARLRLRPAPVNHGIEFRRLDPDHPDPTVSIPAVVANLARRDRRTTLRSGDTVIETCEHVLSALHGLGVDNAILDLEGPEIPGGDGSAAPFVDAIQEVGLATQNQPRRPFVVRQPITVEQDGAMIAALPTEANDMQLVFELEYAAGPVRRQVFTHHLGDGCYSTEIAPARTYLFEAEAMAFREQGLGHHLTPQDILVLGDEGPIGGNTFRFDDELVRHKLLDVIGDLALVGAPLQARIVAYRSGHALHHRLARKLRDAMAAEQRQRLLTGGGAVDVRRITQILPHRYPMLLVDRVLAVEGDRKAIGVKNVTVNEPFFQGHYPGSPIMPGVLIVEAMAPLSGVLLSRKLEHTGKIAVLLSMDRVKLRKPVTPGDQLVLEAETLRVRSRTGHTVCKAFVGEHVAAEAEIKFMLVDAEQE
jgi:UDP-3-O-[3-hydroxymyristoyl] N-acetylglucosamine deacetylase/3-hydroxyacyl-[acyl-carrier-protein] dehydratase